MRHSGKARRAAFKIIILTFIAGVILWALVFAASVVASLASILGFVILPALWLAFSIFTLYFFRDPDAKCPAGTTFILSPAHGKVDVIDKITEPLFLGGECQRISIFLSVLDIHVQNAPVSGKVVFYKYTTGEFMNAIRAECADCNENAYIGLTSSDPPGRKIGLRLIAGVIARRIVPFIKEGDEVIKGERISLVQFGSRGDLYLPLDATIKVQVGDHVIGGETVIAEVPGG
jgi:phosphatidylserine decarboxylase